MVSKVIVNIKIFFMATFAGYAFWRVKYGSGAISKLLALKEILFTRPDQDGVPFIDYHYAARFFTK